MNKFLVVLKKELLDIFRDRKTIIFTLLLPILIYPIMFNITSGLMQKSNEDATKNIVIAIEGNKNSKLIDVLKKHDNIEIKNYEDNTQALKDGQADLILNINSDFDNNLNNKKKAELEILINDKSTNSATCSSYVRDIVNKYSEEIQKDRLKELNLDNSIINPIEVKEKSGINDDGSVNTQVMLVLGMIPALIVILLFTPTIGIAADLGAGEKEKYSMEPLLSTCVSRSALLWGKVFSLVIILILVLIGSVVSLVVSFGAFMNSAGVESSTSEGMGGLNISIDSNATVLIIIFALLLILIISMLQIGVSIYARSTKEANTYLSGLFTPVVIMVLIPIFLDVNNMNFIFYNIPFLNTVCVLKEVLIGVYDTLHIAITFGWNIIYVILTTVFVKNLFSKESIIFRI